MSDARERLTHLLDLAASASPEDRRALVLELSALLLDWPEHYPLSMRAPFDQLLEKAAEDVDAETRAMLASRFAAQPDAPVALLNRLFFDAPDDVKPAILRRNALARDSQALPRPEPAAAEGPDEQALVAATREYGNDPAKAFAKALGVEVNLAARILADTSGDALAAACKGAHLKRTTFSTLALLFAPNLVEKEQRLSAYDAVPQGGAESLVAFWRLHPHTGEHSTQAA